MCRPYSVLHPVGFAMPLPLPAARCALTAPFLPYLSEDRRYPFCGTFPNSAKDEAAGRYPAPFFRGARTFLGEASFDAAARSPGGRDMGY